MAGHVVYAVAVTGILISSHRQYLQSVNDRVPAPYLDEFFHVPQAQTYWAGKWTQWDPKITTPPGLYLWSYAINVIRSCGPEVTTEDLRLSNWVLLYCLVAAVAGWLLNRQETSSASSQASKLLAIGTFPLLFFFSSLYYTDLFSALTVLLTYIVWEKSRKRRSGRLIYQTLHIACGLLALTSRQTNIFWVAIFLGGLQVLDTLRHSRAQIYDPQIEDAYLEAFVVWNGGVVLGDKSNHVATIHLPQLLYIWPFMVFFSWPTMLPQLLHFKTLRNRLPRLWISIIIMFFMGLTVHYNTIVHPFTLADNRHYVFYVFRILMGRWWIKYAAVPVYFLCAWLTLTTLGGFGGEQSTTRDGTLASSSTSISFVLVWLISTALSLATAPLVEPRYFIVPWLIWRMHVPNVVDTSNDRKGSNVLSGALFQLARLHVCIEVVWYMVINTATIWIFLNWEFTWPQEPGQTQRFMW